MERTVELNAALNTIINGNESGLEEAINDTIEIFSRFLNAKDAKKAVNALQEEDYKERVGMYEICDKRTGKGRVISFTHRQTGRVIYFNFTGSGKWSEKDEGIARDFMETVLEGGIYVPPKDMGTWKCGPDGFPLPPDLIFGLKGYQLKDVQVGKPNYFLPTLFYKLIPYIQKTTVFAPKEQETKSPPST